jgi:hypothetical protein
VAGLDPTKHYARAIEIDPANVFAHTMWGFEILRKRGPAAEANRHFAAALESKHEREYVRHMQISALLWGQKAELESEAVRVVNEMRLGGESMPPGTPESSDTWRLWNIYHYRLIYGHDKPQFLSALSPADHLATFRWLYPEDRLPKDKHSSYLYILAQLQELNGDRDGALASYRRLRTQVANSPGRLLDGANAAIARLSK